MIKFFRKITTVKYKGKNYRDGYIILFVGKGNEINYDNLGNFGKFCDLCYAKISLRRKVKNNHVFLLSLIGQNKSENCILQEYQLYFNAAVKKNTSMYSYNPLVFVTCVSEKFCLFVG